MPTQKWRWLAGYHFFREEYLARNNNYITFLDKLDDLQKEFDNREPKPKLEYQIYAWEENFQTEECLTHSNFDRKQIQLVKRGASITKKLKKMGGSHHIGYGSIIGNLLDKIPNRFSTCGELIEQLSNYTPRKGTYRIHREALDAIKFDNERFATATFDTSKPLPIQFIRIYKLVVGLQHMKSESKEHVDYDKLEEIDCDIEYYILTSNKKISYSPRGDTARMIGLWLYDYCKENDCGGPTAITELRRTVFLNKLGIDSKQDREFQRWLVGTHKCIADSEVHALS
ncbi:hypothetical protein [Solidesulfovibrio sp.]|uniref:hypothetical protein n=1 Tax=Solidesulfovibrio sp. TaxID=2910990 RepID=UPI002B1EDBD3|nr:hypothetical protein [Solidesulfovibrio sp.]MEA4856546.1 hypothetical protein [Solidesulfovibrio sp.]